MAYAYLAAGNRDESARQRALSRYHTGQAKLDSNPAARALNLGALAREVR